MGERHGQPHRVLEALADLQAMRRDQAAGELMARLEDKGFARTREMIVNTQARINALARLPQTLVAHDLVRSNLFALRGAHGGHRLGECGRAGPLGVDLAPLVGGSVRRGEASGDDSPGIERAVLERYVQALADEGGRTTDVIDAYQLALGLRWHIVLGTMRVWLDPTATRLRGSRPQEPRHESLHHLLILARHLLTHPAERPRG